MHGIVSYHDVKLVYIDLGARVVDYSVAGILSGVSYDHRRRLTAPGRSARVKAEFAATPKPGRLTSKAAIRLDRDEPQCREQHRRLVTFAHWASSANRSSRRPRRRGDVGGADRRRERRPGDRHSRRDCAAGE